MVGQSNIPITYASEWKGIHGDRTNKNEQLHQTFKMNLVAQDKDNRSHPQFHESKGLKSIDNWGTIHDDEYCLS